MLWTKGLYSNDVYLLADNPITIDHFADLFNCTQEGRGFRLFAGPDLKKRHNQKKKKKKKKKKKELYIYLFLGSAGFSWWFSLRQYSIGIAWQPRNIHVPQHVASVESELCSIKGFICDVNQLLPVLIHVWVGRPPHGPNIYIYIFTTMEAEGYSKDSVKLT